jgi:hypothetical protein
MPQKAMSSFDSDQFVTDLEAIHVKKIARSFNNPSNQPFPQIGCVVLRLVGFGVVTMIGFNLAEAQVGDIAIKITHNGCVSRVKVWVKAHDGASDRCTSVELQQQFHFTSYLT